MTSFDLFFAWCQTCRHGGHAGHLSDWFKVNVDCPVSGCSCVCAALDHTASYNNNNVEDSLVDDFNKIVIKETQTS